MLFGQQPTLVICRRPGHEPIGYAQHSGLFDYPESKPLIKADILEFIGLQISESVRPVYTLTKGSEDGATNSLTLQVGGDGHRSQMPMWSRRVAARPLTCPSRDTDGRPHGITEDQRRQKLDLFKQCWLARAGLRHGAHSHQRVIAESPYNHASFMQATQDRPEKPYKRTRSQVGILNAECPNVYRIIAHTVGDQLGRLIKISDPQIPQRHLNECSQGNPSSDECCLFQDSRYPSARPEGFQVLALITFRHRQRGCRSRKSIKTAEPQTTATNSAVRSW